ncbi:hypothetical protein BvCmsNSNP012_01624 [Escherichia coli]|nr:hypothetical protein BvCmsNSNP012_01624 [Escherichia coli]
MRLTPLFLYSYYGIRIVQGHIVYTFVDKRYAAVSNVCCCGRDISQG